MKPTNAPGNYNFPEEESIDVKRYLSLFISNWYWFTIALFIAITIAYGINRYSEKIYTVTSTLLIKDDQFGNGFSNVETIIPGGDIFKSQQNLKNEIGILKSFMLNYKVMQELKDFHVVYVGVGRRGIVESRMYKTCPFKVVYDSLSSQLIERIVKIELLSGNQYKIKLNEGSDFEKDLSFGERFKEMGFDFILEPRDSVGEIYNRNSSNNYYFYFANLQSLANEYRKKLSIEPIEKDASLVTLSVSGVVPEQETIYLNKLMKDYIQYGLSNKIETAVNTIEFIDNQLILISESLSDAERNLESFRSANRLVDMSREGALIQSRLEKFENEKTGFELQKKYYLYLKEYIETKNETGDIVSPAIMGVTDPQILRLVQELAQLQQQKKSLAMNLGVETTPLNLIEEGIYRVKISLKENIEGGIKSLNNSISDVTSRIAQVEGEIRKLPGTERQMISIQRRFDVNNTVYTYLLEKRAEAGIAKASNLPDNRIIDYAFVFNSSMVKPKTKKNYLMAFVFGLLIPVLGILLIDYLNNKIIDKKDIEKGTDAPIIGYISHNNLDSEIPVSEKPGSSLAESFRSVRTSLRYFIKENKNPVIAVSSTISAEGKTFISINLATMTALSGKKVLLIGLDLRKPRIHKVLEVDNGKGMSTFLSGDSEFEDSIQETKIHNLFYAPSGPIPPNPAELIENERMSDFIKKAKTQFDYIIIDTPPIAIVTDALLIAPFVDMYLLVVRQRYTSRNTLALIQELYKNETIKSLGVVINDISLTGYYGYGLRYGYSIGYGYSYGNSYHGQYVYGRYDDRYGKGTYYSDED